MPPIYMDNAATSWPKPPEVLSAITETMQIAGGNPGRGGHRMAVAAGKIIYCARETVAGFFGCEDPFRVTFTANVTESINLILKGYLKPGDHVLISPMEHNAVMRPLHFLESRNISWSVLPAREDGRIMTGQVEPLIQRSTRLIILCHESNVNGVIQPVSEIGTIAHNYGIKLLADCAQSAGGLPINLNSDMIDFLAFTGHKGLMGPAGTGGIVIGNQVDFSQIVPLKHGGTGSLSDRYDQPGFPPDFLESGTPNTAGIAGLQAGVDWIIQNGLEALDRRMSDLIRFFITEVKLINKVHVYCAEDFANQGNVLSLTIDGVDNGLAAEWFDEYKQIMTRVGLHCAPLAHRTLGTFPDGTIRFAVSPFTTKQDIDACIDAIRELAGNPELTET